jgi:hypothetical protein
MSEDADDHRGIFDGGDDPQGIDRAKEGFPPPDWKSYGAQPNENKAVLTSDSFQRTSAHIPPRLE